MNIFYVHTDPLIAARSLCNRHVVKMAVESAQMLATCFSTEVLYDAPRTIKGDVRKNTSHFNHPSTVWVRESKQHYEWLVDHALELCAEKHRRYPTKPYPYVYDFLLWCKHNSHLSSVVCNGWKAPPRAFGSFEYTGFYDCDCTSCTVTAYRAFYNETKAVFKDGRPAQWTNTNPPVWWTN